MIDLPCLGGYVYERTGEKNKSMRFPIWFHIFIHNLDM